MSTAACMAAVFWYAEKHSKMGAGFTTAPLLVLETATDNSLAASSYFGTGGAANTRAARASGTRPGPVDTTRATCPDGPAGRERYADPAFHCSPVRPSALSLA